MTVRRRRSLSVLITSGLVFWVAVGVVSTPRAQVPAPSPALTGTWRLHGSLADAQAQIEASVGAAVSALNPDMQRLARARIAESTAVPTAIEIQARPELIHLTLAGADPHTFESPPGGSQNIYTRSGVRARLTQTYRPDGGIEQRFQAMDGTQWNFFTPQPDGRTLHLDVLMRSQRLRQEIRFQLVFDRAN